MNAKAVGHSSGESQNPDVAAILASSDVWEMVLPWIPAYWDIDILARYKSAGYTFVSATLQDWPPTFDGMRHCIERFKQMAEPHADWLMFGNSLADIDRGRKEGKLVIGLNSQETRPIGEDLSRIEALYALGVRHMLLAYNVRNLVADGCAEVADAGLSNFGRRVVREMDRLGMIIDVSHTGRRSSLEAIELSERPVIFSHSGAYAVYAHIRNIHDDQIRALAARDGVIGVLGLGQFLGDVEARAETMFRHIDYIATLVGSQHVGIGTDYVPFYPVEEKGYSSIWEAIGIEPWPDPTDAWPDPQLPWNKCHSFQPEQLGELIAIMLAHGYSTEVVKGILGANFRRVYATLS
jgi:membrane dipeptidase